jgi:hypothetical protein
MECRGEQDIEIEQGKWRDQEIRLVYITEFHRFYALSSQDRDSRQYHPKQQNDCQCSEIFWHQNSPGLHLAEQIFSIGADTSALRRAMKRKCPSALIRFRLRGKPAWTVVPAGEWPVLSET